MGNIRKGLMTAVLFAGSVMGWAQKTPEALLGQLPAAPNVVCAADTSVVNAFISRVYSVQAALQQEVDRINAGIQGQEEKIKDQVLSDAARQTGLSKGDLEQLQLENAGEEQARKIAEKSLAKQYDLSLQELEKVGEMNEEQQNKWAQNYASRQMQAARQNPRATVGKQEKSARLVELSKEQQVIGERITSKMAAVARLLKEVELQDTIETRILNEKLPALESQLCSGICSPAEIARSNAAEKQIYNLRLKYCEKMSPLQVNAISQYLTSVKTLFPDYRRLTEVQNEIAILQFGVVVPVDLSCYSAVDKYAGVLLDTFKYWVGKFEQ